MKWTDENKTKLIELKYNSNYSNKELASYFDCTVKSIDRILTRVRAELSIENTTKYWTEEEEALLIELCKSNKLSNINIPGRSKNQIRGKIEHLKSKGILPRINTIRGLKSDLTREELLEGVRKYVSCDRCPTTLATNIKRVFGSWTKALEAAGISGNIGGKFDPNRTTRVYLLDFGDFYKIGITQQQIKSRFSGAPAHTVLDYVETDLDNAVYLEKELKKAIRLYQYIAEHPWFERNGKTECFKTSQPIRYLEDIFAPSAGQ